MRYVTAVCLLAGIGIAALALMLNPSGRHHHDDNDDALVVNDRVIGSGELAARFARQKNYYENREEFIQQVVTNQLLIQEAQRLGIDTEAEFRAAMENYYEQSLIKILMERKHESLQLEVSEVEIDRYQQLLGAWVAFTIATVSEDGDSTVAEERKESSFETLSPAVRMILVSEDLGVFSHPYQLEGKMVRCRLDEVRGSEAAAEDPSRAKVRDLLMALEKESALGDWIESLREKASIVMPKGRGNY